MDSVTRRSGGGLFESLYRVVMRRNSVYVTFVIAGAFLGERAVDYGVHKLWEYNNVGIYKVGTEMAFFREILYGSGSKSCVGFAFSVQRHITCVVYTFFVKRYEDISVLGQRPVEE